MPWPDWSCGEPSSQGLGRTVWLISERLRARFGRMSGWFASTPESRMAMRTPAPSVVFQGPEAAPPGTLSP